MRSVCMHTHDAIVVAVPEQHGPIITCGAVEIKHKGIGAVLLAADIGDMVPDHFLLCCWIHSFHFLCGDIANGNVMETDFCLHMHFSIPAKLQCSAFSSSILNH